MVLVPLEKYVFLQTLNKETVKSTQDTASQTTEGVPDVTPPTPSSQSERGDRVYEIADNLQTRVGKVVKETYVRTHRRRVPWITL